jgi:hypothetical protein
MMCGRWFEPKGSSYMHKHSLRVVPLTRRRAAFRFRQLLAELRLLMGSFPDLRDAVDRDELPLTFILKRDSEQAEQEVRPRGRASAPQNSVSSRTASSRPQHRRNRRKVTSDA